MTQEEYNERSQTEELYQPSYHKIISTENLPLTPVNPNELQTEFENFTSSKGIVNSIHTPLFIEEICKVFNYCIYSNQKGYRSSLVYPAQTGLGKSISLQIYLSMLKDKSSLIVVPTVKMANDYCEFINQTSKDKNYARCYYYVTDKNPKSEERVEITRLRNYRCIVITHHMFKKINESINLDVFKQYQGKDRDFIAIDERLSFYEHFKLDLDKINKQCKLFFKNLVQLGIRDSSEQYGSDLFFLLDEYIKTIQSRITNQYPISLIEEHEFNEFMKALDTTVAEQIELIKLVFETRIKELFLELKDISGLSNNHYQNMVTEQVDQFLDTLENILANDFMYYKNNLSETIFTINHIVNKLGTCVILDATATINEFYKVANRYASNMLFIPAKKIRRYSNLTIYKAKGFKQGRSSIYKGHSKEQVNHNAQVYLSYADSVLNHSTDKLLILCHKDFEFILDSNCDDPRIAFAHWGDHVGRNDLNDCNKVMIVGWNFLNEIDIIPNIINAVGDIERASALITNDVVNQFKTTLLADDLVQAVMRSKARKIASETSDCSESEIYIFYDDTKEYTQVLQYFEQEFPNAKIVEWEPINRNRPRKKTKSENNADQIINYLRTKSKEHQTYLLSDLITELAIPKSTMSRRIKEPYFLEQLAKNGFTLKQSDAKSKHFILQ